MILNRILAGAGSMPILPALQRSVAALRNYNNSNIPLLD
jgi:hypothetical protein